MSSITQIYTAPKKTQPTSNLLNAEFIISVMEKIPKDAKICIFQEPDGDDGPRYVYKIDYDSAKNRATIYSYGRLETNSANAVDKGADWYGGDIHSDSESDSDEDGGYYQFTHSTQGQ